MNKRLLLSTAILASMTATVTTAKTTISTEPAKQPNIIVILADDLGWSDIAPFGSEIKTPNLQTLADNGIKFTNFHATPYSGPSRAALLTGTDPHLVGLGNLSEITTKEQREGNPQGYAGHLNDKAVTVAEYLKGAGYHTIMSGKWHLGTNDEQDASQKGFDKSFTMIRGEYYHFPSQTTQDGKQVVYGNYKDPNGLKMYRLNGKYIDEPANFFSSDSYTDFLIQEINNRPANKPFFAYLAYTAPHSPLQAPQKFIDKYAGMYTDGPQALANKRFNAVKKMGLINQNAIAPELIGTPEWSSLSQKERNEFARRMQVYAAMVDNMDANIGRLMNDLKKRGELENTVIMFMSDNGAAGAFREGDKRWGAWVNETHNNSFANMGRANSYISTGPDWAQASNTPFSLFKGYTSEGGMRSPLIIAGAQISKGKISGSYSNITDITPTVLDIAGVKRITPNGKAPVTGKSLVTQLKKPTIKFEGPAQPRVIESMGGKSVRMGDYKILSTSRFDTIHGLTSDKIVQDTWQLFDLVKDPGETKDIAKQNPRILEKMVKSYDDYAKEVGVVEVSPSKIQ